MKTPAHASHSDGAAPPRRRHLRRFGRRLLLRAMARARRATSLAGRAAAQGVTEFTRSDNLTFAASIAYYTLLSMFPFLLLVLTLLSRLAVASDQPAGRNLLTILAEAVPRQLDFLFVQVRAMAAEPLNLSLLGTLIMLWGSMGVFGAITSAVNHAWGVRTPYGFFKHKLIAFLMMVGAGLLAVVALALVSATEVMNSGWFAGISEQVPELAVLSSLLLDNAATLIFVVVVGLVYYFVPNAKVRLRDVWFGAVLAGVLWRLAFEVFAWYIRDLSRFSVHGSVTAVVVFLIWVYLSAVIMLYGVEVTAAFARLRKRIGPDAPAAQARDVDEPAEGAARP